MRRTSHRTVANGVTADPVPLLRVRDVMRRSPATITPDTRLPEIEWWHERDGTRALLVLDHGTVVGIVTRSDLRAAHVSCVSVLPVDDHPEHCNVLRAADLMSRPVVTVASSASLSAAVRLLLEHHIQYLPVLRSHQLVGLITAADILALLTGVLMSSSVACSRTTQVGRPPR